MSGLSQHFLAYEGLQPIRGAKMAKEEKRTFTGYAVSWSGRMRSNLFKAMILAFIGLLAAVNGAVAASVSYVAGYGIIYRNSGQDYEASAMRLGPNDLRVWTCGTQSGADTIFLTEFNTDHPTNTYSNRTYGPGQVLYDGVSACSPSVLLMGSQFRMYYECATTFYHPDICFATSPDGINWTKYGALIKSPLPPTSTWDGRYGIGHPSAVADKDYPSYTVLYFYDSTYPNQYGGTGLVRGFVLDSNGRTYLGEFTTNFPYPAKVKYYDPNFTNGHGGFYFATAIGTGFISSIPGWFGTFSSGDGVTFSPAGGLLVPNGQLAEDPGQLIANGSGWIQSAPSDLQALIGGGQNQFTAATYVDRFILNLP